MQACGAKTRSGGTCQRAPMPNGRCYLHGGASTGRPATHGRRSEYIRLFGENFAALLADPELLHSDSELALFDRFLLERAELLKAGFSGEWLEEVQGEVAALKLAMFERRDAQGARQAFVRLEHLVAAGGERVAAWGELLDKARQRSELASKAAASLAKQDQTMTESQMVVLFGQMLRILIDVAGTDTAQRVKARFEAEVLGRVEQGNVEPAGAAALN